MVLQYAVNYVPVLIYSYTGPVISWSSVRTFSQLIAAGRMERWIKKKRLVRANISYWRTHGGNIPYE